MEPVVTVPVALSFCDALERHAEGENIHRTECPVNNAGLAALAQISMLAMGCANGATAGRGTTG